MAVLVVKQDNSGSLLPTSNDVLLVANAPDYEDSACFYTEINNYNYALMLESSDAHLTVAGNYHTASYQNKPYNICVYTSADWRRSKDRISWTRISAVEFTHNGTLYLTSQAGARTAEKNKDGAVMNDDNLSIAAKISTQITEQNYTDIGTPAKTLAVNAFYAGENLSVASDLAGTVSANNTSELTYYVTFVGNTKSWHDVSSGNDLSARAINAGSVNFQNNVTAEVTAETDLTITSKLDCKFTSNTLSSVGIYAAEDLNSSAIFCGTVSATNNAVTQVEATLYSGTINNGNSIYFTDNNLSVAAVESDGQLYISVLGSKDGKTANLTAEMENVCLGGTAKSERVIGGTVQYAASNITVTGNTISAAAVKGGTVTIDKVEKGVTLHTSINNAQIAAVTLGGSTFTNILSIGNNNFSAAGISAKTVSLHDFCGAITTTADSISLGGSATGGTSSYTSGDSTVTISGIFAEETLKSDGSLSGTIQVDAKNNTYFKGSVAGGTISSKGRVAGIYAVTITVAGRLDSDISVSVAGISGGGYRESLASGIEVTDLITEAISGTVSADIGINTHKTMKSSGSTIDALDISGTITASECGIYTGCSAAANLRVSGTINASTAIQAENYRNSNSVYSYSDTAFNDMVEVSAGGTISGVINLRYGVNRLILDSSATVKGVTKAENGLLNYIFILNGVAAHDAVISTSKDDDSLYSNSTFNVNLDYAQNGQDYTLYSYNDVDAGTVLSSWKGRQVTFIYKGEVQVATLGDSGSGTVNFSNGASAAVEVKENKIVVSQISNVQRAEALTVTGYEGSFDSKKATYKVTGLAISDLQKYENIEIEYSINSENSIVKRLTAASSEFEITGVHSNDQLKWRIRGVNINESCSTYYYNVSDWSEEQKITLTETVESAIDTSKVIAYASGGYDSYAERTAVNGAAAFFLWNAPDSVYTINYYELQYYESTTELTDAEAQSALNTSSRTVTKNTTAAGIAATGLTNYAYVYWRVRAVDVVGGTKGTSDWVTGESFRIYYDDTTAPTFTSKTVNVTSSKPNDYQKVSVSLDWADAIDLETGLKNYRVSVTSGTTTKTVAVEKDVTWCVIDDVDAGNLSWSVTAIDKAGNETTLNGTHRTISAPVGAFNGVPNAPVISISYEDVNITVTTENEDEDEEEGSTTETLTVSAIASASVVFSWDDTYVDEEDGVYYRIQISSDKTFVDESVVYEFRTTEAGKKSFTLSQVPTYDIGVLSKLSGGNPDKTLYYRVMASNSYQEDVGIWSTEQSFVFKNDDQEGVTPVLAPNKPYNVSVTQTKKDYCYTGEISFSFNNVHEDIGIHDYVLTFKKSGKTVFSQTVSSGDIKISGGTGTISQISGSGNMVDAGCVDGKYSFTVTARNAWGTSATSNVTYFTLDTTRPTTVEVAEGNISVSNTDVTLRWDESYDAFGIDYYEVYYRIHHLPEVEQEEWTLAKQTKDTSVTLYNLGEDEFDFCVYAYDKNGNRSLQSEVVTAVTSWDSDIANTYELAYQDPVKSELIFSTATSSDTASNTVGGSKDSADCLYFYSEVSMSFDTLLSRLGIFSGSKKGITVTVNKYDEVNGLKKIKSVKLGSTGSRSNGLLLEKGLYFIQVISTDKKTINDYDLTFTRTAFADAEVNNNNDDNWQTLDAEEFPVISVGDMATGGVEDEWVGYGDAIDYRKLDLEYAGKFVFSLTDATAPVRLTLYSEQNGKLSKVKSISVKKGNNAMTLVLENSKSLNYYVAVEATSAKSGKNSCYDWEIKAVEQYKEANNEDDNWQTLGDYGDKYVFTYTGSKDYYKDWAGFSDAIDYRKLDLANAGKYTFTLSYIDAPARLTIYQETTDRKGQQVLKKVKTVSVSSGSKSINDLLLEASSNVTYYVAVEATGAKKAKNTEYRLDLTAGEVYQHAGIDNADDNWQTLDTAKYSVACGGKVTNEWVGYGDTIDYRKLTLTNAGSYDFTLTGVEAPVTLTVYQQTWNKKGQLTLKKVKSISVKSGNGSISSLLLDGRNNSYYFAVSANNAAKAQNTTYELAVNGTVYQRAVSGDEWSDLKTMGASGAVGSFGLVAAKGQLLIRQDNKTGEQGLSENWVGYTDADDYVGFTVNGSCDIYFDVTTDGKLKFTVYELVEKNGSYSLKSLQKTTFCGSGTTNRLQLSGGNYYIGINSPDAAKGASVNYSVKVSADSRFYQKPYNGDDTWQAAITQNYSVLVKGNSFELNNWVGYGDAADYWKFQLQKENEDDTDAGWLSLEFDGTTADAIRNGELAVTINDSNGTIMSEATEDLYWKGDKLISSAPMSADVYYLGFTCTDTSKYQTSYQVTVKLS